MTITLNGSTGITTPDIDIAAGLDASDLTGALPAIDGSALTALSSANLTGALPAIDGSSLTGIESGATYHTPATTTSGTAFDFTGIPAGVNEVTVLLNGCGVSGGNGLYTQLGTSGGFVTSGYAMVSHQLGNTAVSAINTFTEGVIVRSNNVPAMGYVKLTRSSASSNSWIVSVHSSDIHPTNTSYYLTTLGGGVVDLGAELTQIRLRVERIASETFNSGSATITWSF